MPDEPEMREPPQTVKDETKTAITEPPEPVGPARYDKPAKVSPQRSIFATILLVLTRGIIALLSISILAATGASWVVVNTAKDTVITNDIIGEIGPPADTAEKSDGATDILLVGSDSRTDVEGNPLPAKVLQQLRTEANAGLNTDTIIVLRIPDNGGKASAISIPRDTYVMVPDIGEEKINSAYARGKNRHLTKMHSEGITDSTRLARESDQAGRLTLGKTVRELTGLRIDHYAEINLYGFYLLTEAVGGVEVCLRRSTSDADSGASFRAGKQIISGGDALSFVRQRNGLPRADLDRIVRQQVFMAAVVNKILSTGTLTNPSKLNALIQAARKSIVMDAGWDPLQFAQQMRGLAGENIRFHTIPVTGVGVRNDKGQSIVTVNQEQVRSFVTGVLTDATPIPSAVPSPVKRIAPTIPKSATSSAPEPEEPITANGLRCVY